MFEITFDAIRALAPAVMAIIAFAALRNWRRQDKAKRELEFLDALVDAVHANIVVMHGPITLLGFARIGMESHAPPGSEEQAGISVEGAIAYIHKDGERQAKRMLEALEAVRPSIVKLKSLAAKGQVFNFHGYAKCRDAVTMLTWQFDRIEAFTAVIGSPSWNWEHPKVLKNLTDVIAIDPEDIRNGLAENNVAVLEFMGEKYKHLYG